MSDLKATFDLTRKRLRHKLGLPAALPPDADASAASSDNPGSGVSVLHRVLAYYEDHKSPDASSPSDYDIIPLPAALSHSLSGTWKQRIADNGKPFWERDAREAASTEVVKELEPVLKQSLQQPTAVRLQGGSSLKAEHQLPRDGQLLLQLPHVHSLQQAKQQSDALQLQAYKKTRKLQEAKFLARQAAERLLSFQMQQSEAELNQSDVRESDASKAAMQKHVQGLRAAQAHMFELSEQVTIAELASELAEARAHLIQLSAGTLQSETASSGSSLTGNLDALLATQSSSQNARLAGSSCDSTYGESELNNNLARVRTESSQEERLRRLSSSLTYVDLPLASPSEPDTPKGDTNGMSVFAPDTPTCFNTPAMGDSSVQSSTASDPAAHDSSVNVDHEPPDALDCESTSGRLQAVTGCTFAASGQQEETSSVLPALHDLPNAADPAGEAKGAMNPMRYVHIGCAVACLCVFVLWARDASAASFSTRMFPT